MKRPYLRPATSTHTRRFHLKPSEERGCLLCVDPIYDYQCLKSLQTFCRGELPTKKTENAIYKRCDLFVIDSINSKPKHYKFDRMRKMSTRLLLTFALSLYENVEEYKNVERIRELQYLKLKR